MFTSFFQKQTVPATSKIVMLILDGLGGLPREVGGKTELETAFTPNLDALASLSCLGLSQPAAPGITVGSGPGHLALFGYDPITNEIGRGVLEALGVDFEVGADDIAARGNFCTVDEQGRVIDRRAGRIPSAESALLVELLRAIQIDGVELFVEPVKEHRFTFILRARGLEDDLTDTDPLVNGVAPFSASARTPGSAKTAEIVNEFIAKARVVLNGYSPANMIMLRGFSKFPTLPGFNDLYKLTSAAVAINGMYRGVARLVGMDVLPVGGTTLADEFAAMEKHWQNYDFFYLHFKKTDTCGEMGDFDGKVKAIEEFDALLPHVTELQPDVLIIGGDHSSPAVLQSHSWHPVPLLLYSSTCRPDGISQFGERACAHGSLGCIPATSIMPLALGHTGRLAKYGA